MRAPQPLESARKFSQIPGHSKTGLASHATQVAMRHYVAYHSAEKMGLEYDPAGTYVFFSRKPLTILQQAVGERVWVINGSRRRSGGTEYSLRAVFCPEQVVDIEDPNFNYAILGTAGLDIDPPIVLNGLPWFGRLLESQNKFSFGFNEIREASCIAGLLAATHTEEVEHIHQAAMFERGYDIDFVDDALSVEGGSALVAHLRRERSRTVVKSKKEQSLAARGSLSCEVCGFDFARVYGTLGEDFCEVHHKVPLASLPDARVTKLSELAVVCSNCHRMLHKGNPMLSIENLRTLLAKK